MLKPLPRMLAAWALTTAFGAAAWAKDVVLYSSVSQQAIDAVVSGFEALHPDIKVSVVRAGSGSLLQRLKAEAAHPQADLVWAGTPGLMPLYKDLLQPYASPEAKGYDPKLIGEDHRWLAVETNLHVFMVNTRALRGAQAPTSWKELLTPQWQGKLIMSNPEQSSSAYEQVASVNDFFGAAAADTLARNAATVSTSSAVNTGVSRGEFPVAVTLEYLAQDYVQHGAKNVEIVYPKDGVFVSYFTEAIVKGARNADSAHLLYDYLASRPGRERILAQSFRRPARLDVDVPGIASLPSPATLNLRPVDEQSSTDHHAAYLERWKQVSQGK